MLSALWLQRNEVFRGEDSLYRWSGLRDGGTYGGLVSFNLLGRGEGWIRHWQTVMGLNLHTRSLLHFKNKKIRVEG